MASDLAAQANWYWSNPMPQGNQVNSVKFRDFQNGFGVCSSGSIIKTTNGGLNWTAIPSLTKAALQDLDFSNSTTIIAAVDSGIIIKSTDLGANWQIIQTRNQWIYRAVKFVNANTGFIAGNGYLVVGGGDVLKTTDGGDTWTEVYNGGPCWSGSFLNVNFGAVGGAYRISVTSNGGTNWNTYVVPHEIPFDQVIGVSYLDSNNIIGVLNTTFGLVVRSSNRGISWDSIPLNVPAPGGNTDIIRGMSFFDFNNGYVVTDYGRILKTTNSGFNWTQDSTLKVSSYYQTLTLLGVKNIDINNVFAFGGGGTVFRSTNAGINWAVQTGYQRYLKSVFFSDQNTGYAAGFEGKILKTTNGGSSWALQNSQTTRRLYSLYFTNTNTGFAVGDTGLILKTTDGGNAWSTQPSGTNISLVKITFTSDSIGYSVGGINNNGNGIILKTTNSGVNWFTQLSNNSTDFSSIFFVNANIGYAVALVGSYKTTNAGQNWILQSGGKGFDIFFSDTLTGYCVSGSGQIRKTTDAGATWNLQPSPTLHNLYSVFFLNNTSGFAAGESGTILYTSNGGTNWLFSNTCTSNNLYSMSFTDSATGFIAGDYGSIISTKNPSPIAVRQNSHNIPMKFDLLQNYPNPFNPDTKIKFKVPDNNKNVKLIVYDILGREEAVLVNENLRAGDYEATFSGSNLSSGVYFYVLYQDSRLIKSQKMLLVK